MSAVKKGAPLVLTIVRHGESLDNLQAVWAGWKDASLSQHGFRQADRLGASFKDVPITAIYASDLKRAHSTAKAIYDQNLDKPKPPFVVSSLLREQHFGDAEGEPWDAGSYSSAHLPWDEHRQFLIANGAESLNDVGHRADLVVRHFVLPHLYASAELEGEEGGHHVVLVAHGIFLAELMFALKRGENPKARFVKTSGYQNTGWTRLEVSLIDPSEVTTSEEDSQPPPPSETFDTPSSPSSKVSSGESSPTAHLAAQALAPHIDNLPPQLPDDAPSPSFRINVSAINQTTHLDGLDRELTGEETDSHSETQERLKAFFAGNQADLKEWTGK